MATITLKINVVDLRKIHVVQVFEPTTVEEECVEIRKRLGDALDTRDFSLYSRSLSKWLLPFKPLGFYNFESGAELEFKSKFRILRVRIMEDAVKTIHIDESLPVQPLVQSVCKKIGISNPDEYSFALEELNKTKKTYHSSEDPVEYLNPTKSLPEQGVPENVTLLLRKMFFFSDSNVDSNDPIQLNLMYVQARNAVVSGRYPCTLDELIQFAAIQSQITHGNYEETKNKLGLLNLKEYLPESYRKTKDAEKRIFNEQKRHANMPDINLKYRYVQLCRALKSYGVTFFHCKEKTAKHSKMTEVLVGVNKECVMRFDPDSKSVLQTWPLTKLRRWAAAPNSFTLDFGDYDDKLFSVQTSRGDQISMVIGGYIEILVKRRNLLDKQDNTSSSPEAQTESSPQSGHGYTVQPVAARSAVQESSHSGNMGVPVQAMYSLPVATVASQRKVAQVPNDESSTDAVMNYQLCLADDALAMLMNGTLPFPEGAPMPDAETCCLSNHSLVALFSSFLASITVLSFSTLQNDTDGMLNELKLLVHLLGPLSDACSKFPKPETQAATARLAEVTKELFSAMEKFLLERTPTDSPMSENQVQNHEQNKSRVLDKVQDVTKAVHLLLATLPTLTVPQENLRNLEASTSYLIALNQELNEHALQQAAASKDDQVQAKFKNLLHIHTGLTSQLSTVLETVSKLITTPHCAQRCRDVIEHLLQSQNSIAELATDQGLEEGKFTQSTADTLTKAYAEFIRQIERGNFKDDVEIVLMCNKLKDAAAELRFSADAESPFQLISDTKALTKTSAELVVALKRKITTTRLPAVAALYTEGKAELTDATTRMVEAAKTLASSSQNSDLNKQLNKTLTHLIKVADSLLLVKGNAGPSEFVAMPLQNASFASSLLSTHLGKSHAHKTLEAVIQVRDCNKRYSSDYPTSEDAQRIALANDMAASVRALLAACTTEDPLKLPTSYNTDLQHCKKSLAHLEGGLEKYAATADSLELYSMSEEIGELIETHKDILAKQSLTAEQLDALKQTLMDFRDLTNQTQHFVKVASPGIGYAGIMRQAANFLPPLVHSELPDRDLITAVLEATQETIQIASDLKVHPDRKLELSNALTRQQLESAALLQAVEKLSSTSPSDLRSAVLECALEMDAAISQLLTANALNLPLDNAIADLEGAYSKLTTVTRRIMSETKDDATRNELLAKVQEISQRSMAVIAISKSNANSAARFQHLRPASDMLRNSMMDFLEKCKGVENGFHEEDIKTIQSLSTAHSYLAEGASKETAHLEGTQGSPHAYSERMKKIVAIVEEITPLLKQCTEKKGNVDLGIVAQICKKMEELVRIAAEASVLLSLVDVPSIEKSCAELRGYLIDLEQSTTDEAFAQAGSSCGQVGNSLCLTLKTHAASPKLPDMDREILGEFSVDIATHIKGLLAVVKHNGVAEGKESILEPSMALREDIDALISNLKSGALPILENSMEAIRACTQLALSASPERVEQNATRVEKSLDHLFKTLQRAAPGKQESSAAMDQISLGIAYIDDLMLRSTMEGTPHIKMEHQAQLYSLCSALRDIAALYKQEGIPADALRLATGYAQLTKVVNDPALLDHIRHVGESFMTLLRQNPDSDAVEVADQLVSILEMRKKMQQMIQLPLETNEDIQKYPFELLCSSTKSMVQTLAREKANFSEDFDNICRCVKAAKKCTGDVKMHDRADQVLQKFAMTTLSVMLGLEKVSAVSGPASNVIKSVRECSRTSTHCQIAMEAIKQHKVAVSAWALDAESVRTPDTAVTSKCAQFNECISSILSTLSTNDEIMFGDAVDSAMVVLTSLLDTCSKSQSEAIRQACLNFLSLLPNFIALGLEALHKPSTHSIWTELKDSSEVVHEALQRIHENTLPDAFRIMAGSVEMAFAIPGIALESKEVKEYALDLIRAAAACQKELVKDTNQGDSMYHDDGTWTEGFVSAANVVVDSILLLSKSLHEGLKERIMACGSTCEADIIKLCAAASVRVDSKSSSLEMLHTSSKNLKGTIATLVERAPETPRSATSMKMRGQGALSQVALIEAQTEVLTIEKQLDLARQRYSGLKKQRYGT